MTMEDKKPNISHDSSKSKLGQKKTWDAKKKPMVNKMLMQAVKKEEDIDLGYDINVTSGLEGAGVRSSQPDASVRDVKKFDDEYFTIQVDGHNLDPKIPIHLRRKYSELCSSQNMFLHKNLIKGMNCDLYAGLILETITIADAIKKVKIANTYEFEKWERTLKALQSLGMEVGFLRNRIRQLLVIYLKSEELIMLKRSERCMEAKLHNLREKVKRLNSEICDLKYQA